MAHRLLWTIVFFASGKRTNETTKETLPPAKMPTAAFCQINSSLLPKLLMPKACHLYNPVFIQTGIDRLRQQGALASKPGRHSGSTGTRIHF